MVYNFVHLCRAGSTSMISLIIPSKVNRLPVAGRVRRFDEPIRP
jgi:hypothetical protein